MQPSSQLSLDDGFQFGLGAFETIAIEHGQPVFPEKHLARLDRAAAFPAAFFLQSAEPYTRTDPLLSCCTFDFAPQRAEDPPYKRKSSVSYAAKSLHAGALHRRILHGFQPGAA